MTKDSIISLPNPNLRQRSQRVGLIDKSIIQLVKDMTSATLDWEDSRQHELGVALAAVQINRKLRVVIIRKNLEDKSDRSFATFINPKITKKDGELEEDFEGCLSIPDIYGKVPRYSKIRVRALGLDGKTFNFKTEGFMARILQHEIDHTNGIVFTDHIIDKKDAFYTLNKEGKLDRISHAKALRSAHLLR